MTTSTIPHPAHDSVTGASGEAVCQTTPTPDVTELIVVDCLREAAAAVRRAQTMVLAEITDVPTSTAQVRMLGELNRLTDVTAALTSFLTSVCTIRLDRHPRA